MDGSEHGVEEVGLARVQDHHHDQQHPRRKDSQEELDEERPHKRPRLENSSSEEQAMMNTPNDVTYTSRQPLAHNRPWFEADSPTLLVTEDDNKENWPPLSSSLSWVMDDMSEGYQISNDGFLESLFEPRALNEGASGRMEDQQESFEPLSFGSRQLLSQPISFRREPYGLDDLPRELDAFGVDCVPEDIAMDGREDQLHGDSALLQEQEPGLALSSEPDMASHALGISAFAHLRARKVSELPPVPAAEPSPVPVPSVTARNEIRSAPPELFDQNTLRLPEMITPAQSVHRYMSSVEFIQKHVLVRALRSSECAVELVERQTLGGVDLIVDPYCAVIFLSLFTLSARCDACTERISQQSWKYSRLFVVFEAYPEHRSKRSFAIQNGDGSASAQASELYAYTQPIVKAIKKFRRDVNIADACGAKCADTKVEYAFADTVNEAALLTRWFGERAEEADETGGILWGEREWLAVDFSEV
jgi:hypothetical protein